MKKAAAFLVTAVLTLLTIVLLFTTFSIGGWWFALLIVWMPIFWLITAWLGYPAGDTSTPDSDGSEFIDLG